MDRIETAEAPVIEAAKVLAFKGFDMDLSCTPDGKKFQFAIGESYSVDGEVQACRNGFHAYPYPLDVFKYYAPANHRFAVVELSGDMDVDGDKTAARTITVVKEVTIREMVETAVQLTIERAKLEDGSQATGERGAASATGTRGAASAKGKFSAAMASGFNGKACGVDGAALFLVERLDKWGADDHGKIIAVWTGIVGQDGIKADTFYTLQSGKPVEVA